MAKSALAVYLFAICFVLPFASGAVSCHHVLGGHTYDLGMLSRGTGSNYNCLQNEGCISDEGDIYFNLCHVTIDDLCPQTGASVCIKYPNGNEVSAGNVNSQKFSLLGNYFFVRYENGDPCNTGSGSASSRRTTIHCLCDETIEDLVVDNGTLSDGDCHYDVYVSSEYCCYRKTQLENIEVSQGGSGGFVGAHAGVPTNFFVSTFDEFGVKIYNSDDAEKLDFWLFDSTGKIILNISGTEEDPPESGDYKVSYTTTLAGTYTWNATYAGGPLSHIDGHVCTVYPGALDPEASHASGPGVGGNPGPWEIFKPLSFNVYLYDQYGNEIEDLGTQEFQIFVAGDDVLDFVIPRCVEIVDQMERTNVYECTYTAEWSGTYFVTVRIGYEGHHYAIKGSPYRVVINSAGVDWAMYVSLVVVVVFILAIIVVVIVGSLLLWVLIERQKSKSEEDYTNVDDGSSYETPIVSLTEPGMGDLVPEGKEVDT